MPGVVEREKSRNSEIDPKNMLDRGVEELLLGIKQGTSQRLMDYLAFTARFHRYSLSNQILIYTQNPQATSVAGYQTWKKMGYQVAKGEKGIRIFAPRPYTQVDDETGEERERISFTTVSVFDVSQLDNTERAPPTFFERLPDDQQELYEKLEVAVRADGISLEEGWTGPAQGYSAGKRIVLRKGLDSRNRFHTLIHEYAHELLHWGQDRKEKDPRVRECHAEAVAFVVAHRFGIYNPYSADYLHNWGTTPEKLKEELEVVRKAASYIIDRIEEPSSNDASPPEFLSPT